MRAGGDPQHKALVRVAGIPMLDRNLMALRGYRFHDIAISVNRRETELTRHIERLAHDTRFAQMAIRTVVETKPLGTIGAARVAHRGSGPLLVVNADNLTLLDLRAFVEHHVQRRAAMTIASHDESMRLAFGELRVESGDVLEYLEKPVHRYRVSSGTYVLGPDAIALIEADESIGIPALFERVRAHGLRVSEYFHQAPWIDVNDRESVRRADEMVASWSVP